MARGERHGRSKLRRLNMTSKADAWKKITTALQDILDGMDQIEMADQHDDFIAEIAAIRELVQDIRSEAHGYMRPDLKEKSE
jgi:hypothetical protein